MWHKDDENPFPAVWTYSLILSIHDAEMNQRFAHKIPLLFGGEWENR